MLILTGARSATGRHIIALGMMMYTSVPSRSNGVPEPGIPILSSRPGGIEATGDGIPECLVFVILAIWVSFVFILFPVPYHEDRYELRRDSQRVSVPVPIFQVHKRDSMLPR